MSSVPESLRLRREVSRLEPFDDLVFVFAVSQLSHHLVEHLTWRGARELLRPNEDAMQNGLE
ncbi:low temperature requirement protein A [Streptomyces sp. NBC_00306]|uniref:low temperature requirement protein A n=1 Tax=Streptomyces sp. NBC_00306 TaxID=2975708 RepID=UPI002E2B6C2A|nr:low temperature requirement protein A [Streptomyces sp. NBC_00306]